MVFNCSWLAAAYCEGGGGEGGTLRRMDKDDEVDMTKITPLC
jgi:hypothetical protein